MPAYTNTELFNYLKELNTTDIGILKQELDYANKNNILLGESVIQRGVFTDGDIGLVVSDMLSIPYIDVSIEFIPEDVLYMIPEEVARAQRIIAFRLDEQGLHIATEDPSNRQIIKFLENKSQLKVFVYFTTHNSLKKALTFYSKKVTSAFEDLLHQSAADSKNKATNETSIKEVVDTMLTYASKSGASDIHIEPTEDSTLVRFRVDGILHDIVDLPVGLNVQIVTRIKVLAKLRTDEHQETQDGKFTYRLLTDNEKEEDIDIRVSIAPVILGEKVVMRLLSATSRNFSLVDLGFGEHNLQKVQEAYKLPHGMILSTGPTGSGKTTTLYAILKQLNKREVNIMTIEDPVEYQMDNINHMQVNNKADFTFAKGLRSIVRQDPDIILVGEIRDAETASIAVNSAMTGHLVLSSLHTNDAVTTFPRLIDMGIEPYLVASTVNIVVAQRLVRKICLKCKVSIKFSDIGDPGAISKYFKDNPEANVFHGKGCETCKFTGYAGRIAIFEVLKVSDTLRKAITEKQSTVVLSQIALNDGMTSMLDDGIEKVTMGITTIEELLRVTKE